jgi:glycosyltransferase involved in cell wall biosynthesis
MAGPRVVHRALQPFDTGLDWFAPGLMRTVERARPDVILCMGRMANCYAGSLQGLVQDRWPHIAVIATMRTGKRLPWLFRRSLRQVRHIVANSREAGQTLVTRHGIAAEKISVIYNSLVFPAESTLARDEARRGGLGATQATSVLLNVAMFRPEKNHRELIEIIGELPRELNFQLWLAGDGPARAGCERLVAARHWGDVVKFLGYDRDPAPLYAAANLAVHASASESLSNFLIEAQAHGLPLVACAAQGIAECCVPGETGFVIPRGDHAAFRAALTRLIREPAADRARRAARARAFARETFDPQRQAAAYLGLFEKLSTVPAS